jgi:predicted transcriptional regulator
MAKRIDLLDKKTVLRSLKSLPDRFNADDAIERIIILEKIAVGMADVEAGRTVSLEDAKKRMAKWLK